MTRPELTMRKSSSDRSTQCMATAGRNNPSRRPPMQRQSYLATARRLRHYADQIEANADADATAQRRALTMSINNVSTYARQQFRRHNGYTIADEPAGDPERVDPTPASIALARQKAGHTQTQAASLIYKKLRAWQQWEAGDRKMDPALFELYRIKTQIRS